MRLSGWPVHMLSFQGPLLCTHASNNLQPAHELGRLLLQVASGGVVRDPKIHQQVLESVSSGIAALGFTNEGSIESPLKGATGGNTEFLAVFKRQ